MGLHEEHEEAEPFLSLELEQQDDFRHTARTLTARWYDVVRSNVSQIPIPKSIGRKYFYAAAGCLLLLLTLLLPPSRRGIARLTTSRQVCSSARLNPHHVTAPTTPDIARLTAFWPDLSKALVEHGHDLPQLEHPPWLPDDPSEEFIRQRTDLISQENATLIRERHAGFIRDMPAYPAKTFKGRGIVMLAGGKYSEYAVTALGVLRESGSTLPVEVWRRDEREEKHEWCDEIEQEGMVCRRLSDYLDTDILAIPDGKEMKVFSMLFSSFEEVFFLDSDNLALQPPENIFDSAVYQEKGVVLWHDYWHYDNIDWLDYVVGISDDRSEVLWEQINFESGQIAWHKRKQWDALLLATYYNFYGPDLYYTLLNTGRAGWGDKDTFPLALRALDKPFHAVSDMPENAWVNGMVGKRRTGMLQMGITASTINGKNSAKAAFLHATTVKWSHRTFLCNRCLPIWHTEHLSDDFKSDWETPESDTYTYLHENVRIIDPEYLQWMPTLSATTSKPLDAEIRIWRAMEYAACRSIAWRHARTCAVARQYLSRTFGFTFVMKSEPGRNMTKVNAEAWLPGVGEESCLVDPL